MTIFWMAVTVLVVDDHSGFRASARRILELDGFTVIAEAENGATALDLAERLEPELVLLDVGLPDASGFEIAERMSRNGSKVILVSSREEGDFGRQLRRSGALGFVSKDRLAGAALHALLERRA